MDEARFIHFEHADRKSGVWHKEEEEERQSRVKKLSVPALD